MRGRVGHLAGLALGALLLVSACGGEDDGIFDEQVAEVRAAVEAGDRPAALAAMDDLAVVALGAHEEGQVDDAELQELAALIDHARAQLDAELPEPTTTTEPPPPVDHDDDHDDDDEGDHRGRGKGKGSKGDDDD